MKWSKRFVRNFLLFLLKGVSALTRLLPWRMAVYFGGQLGILAYFVLPREKRRSLEGLRTAFGAEKSEDVMGAIAKRNFCNLGKGLIEILNLKSLKKKQLEALISVEGEEYLKAAEAAGKGTILITGHIGNWELMAAALSIRGYRLHVIATPLYDPRIDELVVKLRAGFKIETISRGTPSSSRKILNVLRSKEILGLLIDQDTKVDGVFVNFFNKKAHTPAGAAQLALRSGAATMMCFVTRLPGDRHRITIEKPMRLVQSGNKAKDIEANTAMFTSRIEEHVKQFPDQWVWMHRRWKTKPEAGRSGSEPQ
ncbi:MAG: lysophospholipid acyltransferase family protein [Nitrospiria bacterium]